MRRRLWWSLKLFDTRIGELADYKTVALAPTWDCRVPLNVNDSDLRPEMKEPPQAHGTSSEALFVVVRSELVEFVRHTKVNLDFSSPLVARDAQNPDHKDSELDTLEKTIEDQYLKFCNPENPLHFMTLWTTRIYLAKCRLLEHYSRYSDSLSALTEPQRDTAMCHALTMLESDTKIMTSPLTKGYLWLARFHFPFPAYMHILQDLRRRPVCKHAEQAWKVMSENFEARVIVPLGHGGDSPFLNIFAGFVLPAWEARETIPGRSEESSIPPRIVSYIKDSMTRRVQSIQSAGREQQSHSNTNIIEDLHMLPMGRGDYGFGLYGLGELDDFAGTNVSFPGQALLDANTSSQLDCAAMDWRLGSSTW